MSLDSERVRTPQPMPMKATRSMTEDSPKNSRTGSPARQASGSSYLESRREAMKNLLAKKTAELQAKSEPKKVLEDNSTSESATTESLVAVETATPVQTQSSPQVSQKILHLSEES